MKILVVSSYPPEPCGIAAYAKQHVDALRREGHRVDVLCPEPGDGDFQENLCGRWGPLQLLRYVFGYDQVYIHYVPPFFYDPDNRTSRFMTSFAFLFLMLLAGKRIHFVIHEAESKVGGAKGRGPLRHRIDRWYWRLAKGIYFHTDVERLAFAEHYRLSADRKEFVVWPHNRHFVPHCDLTQKEARQILGLNQDAVIFLCIGFIQPHKGYDRAMLAMQRVPARNFQLYVVGSVRIAWDVIHHYAQYLHYLADCDPRQLVCEGFISDELFDVWVNACDYIVVPYKEIWSSGIAARASLYHRPLIASNKGGLSEQMTQGSMLFGSDEELCECFQKIAALHPTETKS